MPSCRQCLFGRHQGVDKSGRDKGVVCKRHPPVVMVRKYVHAPYEEYLEQNQPWVASDDWCGEYKPGDR